MMISIKTRRIEGHLSSSSLEVCQKFNVSIKVIYGQLKIISIGCIVLTLPMAYVNTSKQLYVNYILCDMQMH